MFRGSNLVENLPRILKTVPENFMAKSSLSQKLLLFYQILKIAKIQEKYLRTEEYIICECYGQNYCLGKLLV